jgi:hypothetical protein
VYLHCSFKILLRRGNSKEKEKNYQVLQFYAFSVYLNPSPTLSKRSFIREAARRRAALRLRLPCRRRRRGRRAVGAVTVQRDRSRVARLTLILTPAARARGGGSADIPPPCCAGKGTTDSGAHPIPNLGFRRLMLDSIRCRRCVRDLRSLRSLGRIPRPISGEVRGSVPVCVVT